MTRYRSFAPSTGTFIAVPKENEKSEPFSNRKQVRIFLVWWARVDSNHRSWKAADLQSVPIGHSGTRPNSIFSHRWLPVYLTISIPLCQLLSAKNLFHFHRFGHSNENKYFLRRIIVQNQNPVLIRQLICSLSWSFIDFRIIFCKKQPAQAIKAITWADLELVTGVEPATHWLQMRTKWFSYVVLCFLLNR